MIVKGWRTGTVELRINLFQAGKRPLAEACVCALCIADDGAWIGISDALLALVVRVRLQNLHIPIGPRRPRHKQLWVQLGVLLLNHLHTTLLRRETEHREVLPTLSSSSKIRQLVRPEVIWHFGLPDPRTLCLRFVTQSLHAKFVVRSDDKLDSSGIRAGDRDGSSFGVLVEPSDSP